MDLLPGSQAPRLSLQLLDGDGGVRWIPNPEARAEILFFFKVECPTSPLAVPAIEGLRTAYASQPRGPVILAISQDEPVGTRAWVQEQGLSVPVAIEDAAFAASSAFKLRAVPTAVVLDGDGRIAAIQEGWSRRGYEDLARAVARVCGLGYVSVVPEASPPFRPG